MNQLIPVVETMALLGSALVAIVSLVAYSRMVSNEDIRVAVFSVENLRGTMKWWLFGAPFYLFLIFAPDKYFLDEEDQSMRD